MTPEHQLLARAKEGDSGAFDGLVRLHEGRLRSFFATHAADPSRSEDLSQETFLRAYRALRAFDPALPFYPWLKGIAWNVLRNEARKARPETPGGDWDWTLEAAREELPEDRDLLDALRSCVEKLDGPARDMVRARYLEGVSLSDLAARTQRDPHALSMAFVRIREVLRDCMTRSSEEER